MRSEGQNRAGSAPMVDVVEGVVVDNSLSLERVCRDIVESHTQWDWGEGPRALPDYLQHDLRAWLREVAQEAWLS